MSQSYDVILVGGGMVGLTLAALLDDRFRIAIIDPAPQVRMNELPEQFASRVSALSRSSQRVLQKVSAWPRIPKDRLTPYQAMVVWDANGSSELTFDAQSLAEPDLGHIVENQVVRAALVESLDQRAAIDWFPLRLQQCERKDRWVHCTLENGEALQASLLIGADGAQSMIRSAFAFDTEEQDYQQLALVANIKTERPHELTAWQRFLPTGPMAYLPLPDRHQCSIVWSAERALAQQLLALSPEQQQKRIAIALDHRLGAVELLTELKAFPLIARHSDRYLQQRVALIGDAAHTIHPLAGQGVNLGLLDAAELAQQLLLIKAAGHDLGDARRLRPFERRRKGHNHLIQKSMSALNWVYQQELPALVVARNLGVSWLNQLAAMKNNLIREAMGLVGDLPQAAQRH